MTSFFKPAVALLVLGFACASQALAQASNPASSHAHHGAPHNAGALKGSVLPFDEKIWVQLLTQGPRPAAYLFTTSYCSTCPAAFAVLHDAVKKRATQPPLNAVMMDVLGPQALRHAKHFKGMTQMYAFDGFEPAIRQAVDPNWPNVTPYVVLVDRKGQAQRVIGPPPPEMLRRWLAAH
ncbi:hypothetical protein [Limnohabitans sp. Rim8]|jgi:hypothetical protein|uniref:hypothetical protein n=1 Tax=Limnohabitans sp. Rim8 TaxID=1100718 RepID=UPI0025E8D467|nr:hypothetical protein [Limnohabitans sp. Rim8]